MYRKSESALIRELDSHDCEFGNFYNALHIDDRRYVREKISHLPRSVQRILINQYQRQATSFLANTHLRQVTDQLNQILPSILLTHFDAGEDELRIIAEEMSIRCRNIELREYANLSPETVNGSEHTVNEHGRANALSSDYKYPQTTVNACRRLKAQQRAYQHCADFVNEKGVGSARSWQKSTY